MLIFSGAPSPWLTLTQGRKKQSKPLNRIPILLQILHENVSSVHCCKTQHPCTNAATGNSWPLIDTCSPSSVAPLTRNSPVIRLPKATKQMHFIYLLNPSIILNAKLSAWFKLINTYSIHNCISLYPMATVTHIITNSCCSLLLLGYKTNLFLKRRL